MCISNIPTNLSVGPQAQAPVVVPTTVSQTFPSNYDPMDFSSKYNTKLSPVEEEKFLAWAKKNGRSNDTYDYDLRGAWKEIQKGKMSEDDRGHLGDKYKKPNHPTFSDQSVYHGKDGYKGGSWGRDGDKDTFTPSATHMWSQEALTKYFADREPNAYLQPRRGK